MKTEDLIKKIKQKPELQGIAGEFVKSIMQAHLSKLSGKNLSQKDEKILIKEVRAELRLHVGRFQKPKKSGVHSKHIHLTEHLSTDERLPNYSFLKGLVQKLNPSSILDLGCGLNPLALAESGITYYACDVNEKEIEMINEHFRKKNISGRAYVADLRTCDEFPSTDICLMLKILDIIDKKNHVNAERLIKEVHCRNIIISFPTRKISGKKMNRPRRIWVEKMLARLGYSFEKYESGNEMFYVVAKPEF